MGLRRLFHIGAFALFFNLSAQTGDYQEEVHLSLNTTNVLVGETIHFSAFVYSNKSKQLSKLSSVLYVELIDKDGRSIFQTKIGLRGGRGAGSVYIDPEWMSNTYRILAYTRWMKNYESFFEQKLLVFNPYNGLIQDDSITGNPLKWQESLVKDVDTFEPLENISIDLGPIKPASLAIGIRKSTKLYYPNDENLENLQANIHTYSILPEYRYALIQGKVIKSSGDPSQIRVNMIAKGSSMQLATTKTDEFGRFWMSYNPDLSANSGEVQIEVKEESANISIVDEFYNNYPQLSSGNTLLDSGLISELIDRSVNSQIQRAYQEMSINESSNRNTYIHQNAIVYYLDDYTRFSSVRDTFIELTSYVGVSKKEDNYKMIVRCENLPYFNGKGTSSLLLLDGLSVTAEEILNQSPNNIEKIEVLPRYYFVNDIAYAGIVSVHSNASKNFKFNPLGHTFSITDYQSYTESGYSLKIDENLPLYEPNLLWNPIYTHNGGTLNLDFSTPRLEGSYVISVTGITQSGEPVNLTRYFQVSELIK